MLISFQKFKIFSIKTLLAIDFIVLLLFIIFYFKYGIYREPTPQPSIFSQSLAKIQVVKTELSSPPVQLIIPTINVNTRIQPLGITPKNEMEVPENIIDVGWFKFGPIPGETGSAVIAGHFNGKNNEIGVFANLNKLKKGDQLFVTNEIGISTTFIVQSSRLYDPGYAENVFNSNDKAHLNLITCDGTWDKIKKSFSKRLVVLTDIAN